MKRIFVLPIVVGLILAALSSNAMATSKVDILDYDETTHIIKKYDYWGNLIGQSSKTTTTITKETTDDNDTPEEPADDIVSTTTDETTQTVSATYRNGALKTDKMEVISTLTDESGNILSETNFKDTYIYDDKGILAEVKGSGTIESTTYDIAGKVLTTTTGTIVRTFVILNGQAALTQQVNDTTTKDAAGNKTGSAKTTTEYENTVKEDGQVVTTKSIATTEVKDKDDKLVSDTVRTTEYEHLYRGGSWVVYTETEIEVTQRYGTDHVVIVIEELWFATAYTRGDGGELTGLVKVLVYGEKKDSTTGGLETFEAKNYSATITNHARYGWYIQEESFDWQDQISPSMVPTGGPLNLDLYALGLSPDIEVEFITDANGIVLQVVEKGNPSNVLMTFSYTDETHTKLSSVTDSSGKVLLQCNYSGDALASVEDRLNQAKTIYHTEGNLKGKIDKVVALSGNEVYLLFNEGAAHNSLSSAQGLTDMNYTSREVVLRDFDYDANGNLTDIRYYTWTSGDHTNGTHARFVYRHDTFDASGKLTNRTWYNDPTHSNFEPTLTGVVVKTEGAIAGSGPEYFLKVDNGNGTFTYYQLSGRDEGSDMSADYNQDGNKYGGVSTQLNAQDWESLAGKQISIQGYHVSGHAESGIYFQGKAAEAFRVIGPITIL